MTDLNIHLFIYTQKYLSKAYHVPGMVLRGKADDTRTYTSTCSYGIDLFTLITLLINFKLIKSLVSMLKPISSLGN
jgi:hypothetical protein